MKQIEKVDLEALGLNNMNNMNKEEFLKLIKEDAKEYAHCTIVDPKEHQDAVDTIIYDYTSGALKAYELLTSKNE